MTFSNIAAANIAQGRQLRLKIVNNATRPGIDLQGQPFRISVPFELRWGNTNSYVSGSTSPHDPSSSDRCFGLAALLVVGL